MGLALAGGEKLLQSTGIIAGLGATKVMYLPAPKVSGAGIDAQVAGSGISETVSGVRRRSRMEA